MLQLYIHSLGKIINTKIYSIKVYTNLTGNFISFFFCDFFFYHIFLLFIIYYCIITFFIFYEYYIKKHRYFCISAFDDNFIYQEFLFFLALRHKQTDFSALIGE